MMDLLKAPWFQVSPNIWTIAGWCLMMLLGAWMLARYEKRGIKLRDLAAAWLVLMGLVMIMDLEWVLVDAARWLPLYPASRDQLIFSGLRDLSLGLVFLLISFRAYVIPGTRLTRWTLLFYALNLIFLIAWFWISPDPSLTDYTFATRHGYSDQRILQAFLISHVLGRFLVLGLFLTAMPMPQEAKT